MHDFFLLPPPSLCIISNDVNRTMISKGLVINYGGGGGGGLQNGRGACEVLPLRRGGGGGGGKAETVLRYFLCGSLKF